MRNPSIRNLLAIGFLITSPFTAFAQAVDDTADQTQLVQAPSTVPDLAVPKVDDLAIPSVPVTTGLPETSGTEPQVETEGQIDVAAQSKSEQDLQFPTGPQTLEEQVTQAKDDAVEFLVDGGPSIWAIGALSVITVALILWKIWRLACIGAWSKNRAIYAVTLYERGDAAAARTHVMRRTGIRSKVIHVALEALMKHPEATAREETARVAKRELSRANSGLRALELIATIAPLLGLLGTVMGMIAAFQALQEAGSRADPAILAGGIWEALLTTAAGMAVAIPASAALTWFESVTERIRQDLEDNVTRLFVSAQPQPLKVAAE